MMRALRWIWAAAWLAPIALAQGQTDVSFILAPRNGRMSLRLGESVDVEFRLASSLPGRYRIWTTSGTRYVRISRFDKFLVEPAQTVVDPLRDIPAQFEGGVVAGVPPAPVPLTAVPMVFERHVNEWISFRQPGRYRITVETTRVETTAQPPASVTLRSNPIEIEIVAPEAGWAAAQLRQAVAMLERGDPPPPVIGQTIQGSVEQARTEEMAHAGRVLRFLETRDAVPALARFFEHGPQAAQQEIRAGLFASPYRKEVIAAMEESIAAPGTPVTYYYLATLMELAAASRMGPSPLYPQKDPQAHKAEVDEHSRYLARMKPIEGEYFAKLADAIERKQGEARAVSLDTLVSRGPQPPAPAIIAALLANFRSLPPGSQHALLSFEWPRIASPSIEPLVRSLAEGRSPLRDEALLRLYDLNPEQARRIAVERIRKADVTREMFQNPRALLLLPDRELPELDEALVGMLEQGKPVELLLSRYASAAGFARVRQFAESRPGAFCGPLLAYFFRIDPAYAAERRALARSSGWGGCSLSLAPNEDLLMSPALEKAAIDDLASPDPMAQRTAQSLLQNGGSAAARQPLWEGFARLRGSRPAPMNQSMLEFGYVEALLKAAGWALTPPEVDRLMAACLTDNCRATVASERRALQTPLRITMMTANGLYASVGPSLLRSRRQLEEKIAQFPKGTSFVFERGYEGTWFREQRSGEIRRILDASGMTAIIQPARP